MAQFTVYRNKNPQTRSTVPFLLDIQNDLLDDLETRVVVPLCPVRPG
jgi:toxin CcdB